MQYRNYRKSDIEQCVCGRRIRIREYERRSKFPTPMAIALRNGKVSDIIDVENDGLWGFDTNGGIF